MCHRTPVGTPDTLCPLCHDRGRKVLAQEPHRLSEGFQSREDESLVLVTPQERYFLGGLKETSDTEVTEKTAGRSIDENLGTTGASSRNELWNNLRP